MSESSPGHLGPDLSEGAGAGRAVPSVCARPSTYMRVQPPGTGGRDEECPARVPSYGAGMTVGALEEPMRLRDQLKMNGSNRESLFGQSMLSPNRLLAHEHRAVLRCWRHQLRGLHGSTLCANAGFLSTARARLNSHRPMERR